MILIYFKVEVFFNKKSADIKTKSADIEKYHNFERNEDPATVC